LRLAKKTAQVKAIIKKAKTRISCLFRFKMASAVVSYNFGLPEHASCAGDHHYPSVPAFARENGSGHFVEPVEQECLFEHPNHSRIGRAQKTGRLIGCKGRREVCAQFRGPKQTQSQL
jgi:hypothetical protein